MAEQKADTQPAFRLTYYTYFGPGARAEAPRWAAALAGLCWEDVTLTQQEMNESRAAGQRRWRGVPELTILDKQGKAMQTIGQCNSILRLIGTAVNNGLYPSNAVEAALCDEICDSVEDVLAVIMRAVFVENEQEREKAKQSVASNELPYWLGKFEARLEENERRGYKNGFAVADSMSIADLKLCVLRFGRNVFSNGKELYAQYKRLNALMDKVCAHDKIRAFDAKYQENVKQFQEKKSNTFVYKGKYVPMC